MKKRLLSALLVLVLVLSLVPFGAFAADATEPTAVPETQATEPAKASEPTQETEATQATDATEVTEATETTAATEMTEPTVPETTAPSEPTAVEKVQLLINALPDTITAENRAEVEAQLTAIDDAKLPLTEEERDALDFGKYNAAIAALNALDGMGGAETPRALGEEQYSISFDANGGTLPEGTWGGTTDIGGSFSGTFPIPTKSGCVFLGWYNGEIKWEADSVATADTTLTAKWSDGSKVTSEAELRACLDAGISPIKLGDDITLNSVLEISGKTLTLDLNGHELKGSDSITVQVENSGNLTVKDSGTDGKITGKFCVKVMSSTFTLASGCLSGANGITTDGQNVTVYMKGGSITSSLYGVWGNSYTNFIFEGGSISGNSYSIVSGGTSTLTGGSILSGNIGLCENRFVYLQGTSLGENVRFEAMGTYFTVNWTVIFKKTDGTICAGTAAEKEETVATPTAPTAPEGTVFAGWYTSNGKKWDFEKDTVTSDLTLYAEFQEITYTITYDKGEYQGTSMADAEGTIPSGTKTYGVDYTLTPSTYTKDGFIQVGWEDEDGNPYYGGQTYTADADLTLTAVWEKEVKYTLPFTKTVKQNGSTKPGEATFSLHICGVEDLPEISGTIDCNAKVTTKGTGSFTGTLTISGSEQLVQAMLHSGIYVQEWDSEMDKWTYDNRVYFLRLKEGTDGNQLEAYAATAKTVDKVTTYTPDESKTVSMTFTNTYGTATTTADSSNPKTGDTIHIAAATCLLSAMALIAILPRKKRM